MYKFQEAAYALSNISEQEFDMVHKVVNMGGLLELCSLLDCDCIEYTLLMLEAVENILSAASNHDANIYEEFLLKIEEGDGIDLIKALQKHDNEVLIIT